MWQRGQAKPPAPGMWHPWKAQGGGGHPGVPTLPGDRGPPAGHGPRGGLGRAHRPARRWLWWLPCLKPPLLRWDGRGRAAAPLALALPAVYHRH